VLSDDELARYRRTVAEHCIYGVDVNPMAVELAKVALWLKTMAADRPLTFLDHHLKCGNSLLGLRLAEIGADHGASKAGDGRQANLYLQTFQARLPTMLDDVLKILERETRDREDVQLKQSWDRAVEEIRAPFVAVADVYLAEQFGIKAKVVGDLLWLLHEPAKVLGHPAAVAAGPKAREKCFFHWELMFPEVFFDRHGQTRADAGFDAVIGNPPWVRQESLKEDKTALWALYPGVFDGVADIYVFFIGAALALLAPEGRFGMILPNKWLRANYAEPLRRHLVEHYQPLELTDFGHAPIFPDADTFPCILVARHRTSDNESLRFFAVPPEVVETRVNLGILVRRGAYPVNRSLLQPDGWRTVPPEVGRLLEKIQQKGQPLKEFCGRSPLYGVKTGFNEAFLIDQLTRDRLVAEDPACEPIIKKFLRGRDIERWHPRWGGEWMIALRSSFNHAWPWSASGTDAEKVFKRTYPSLHRHMKSFEMPVRARQDQGTHWWELRSCDYYDKIESPKIVYQEIQFHSWFAIDEDAVYLNNLVHFLPVADWGLLAVLNSSLIWWYMEKTAPHKKDEAYALHGFYVETLPIVRASGVQAKALHARMHERQLAEARFLDWLRLEIGLDKPSRKLETFWKLNDAGLAGEIKKAGLRLSPAALERVRNEFHSIRAEILSLVGKSTKLERLVHQMVFELYGLTPEEIDLLRRTPVPRDPLRLLDLPDGDPPADGDGQTA
jgi:hypothetical protein